MTWGNAAHGDRRLARLPAPPYPSVCHVNDFKCRRFASLSQRVKCHAVPLWCCRPRAMWHQKVCLIIYDISELNNNCALDFLFFFFLLSNAVILSGQWCNISASLPLSLLLQQFDKSLNCITLMNYSHFPFTLSVSLCCTLHPLCAPHLWLSFISSSISKSPNCFWLPGTGCKDVGVFAASLTLSLFSPPSFTCSFHTDSHLPPLFHLLLSRWMTWLPYPPPCSFTSWFKNKHGGGLAVVLCSSVL